MVLPRHISDEHGLVESIAIRFEVLKDRTRQLYEGETSGGVRFRYALLVLDIVTVTFIIATSFLPRGKGIESITRRRVRCLDTCGFLRALDYQPTSAARLHPSLDMDGSGCDDFT